MGFVTAINKSISKGHTVQLNEGGYFIQGFGLEGDSHGGRNNRHVSLFGQESIDQMEEIGAKGLCTSRFNENIITQDIRLFELPIGTRLKIGDTIQEISQVGKKCYGCELSGDNGGCTLVKEVVFTLVIKGGMIRNSDTIEVLK